MKRIIEEELAEGRTVGLITGVDRGEAPRYMFVGGTVARRDMIPPARVYAVTRSGRDTSGSRVPVLSEEPEAEETPQESRRYVDEAGNEWSEAEWLARSEVAGEWMPVDEEEEGANPEGQSVDESESEDDDVVELTPGVPGVQSSSSSVPVGQMVPPVVCPLLGLGTEWVKDYVSSAQWGELWQATQTPGSEWPQGIRLHHGTMVWDGRICVPESRVLEVVQGHHEIMGHAGIQKVVKEVQRRYALPVQVKVYETVRQVRRGCATCQACDAPNWRTSLPISHTPVPSHVMTSIALDVFALPAVKWQGQEYDSLLLCVDRLSGWMIARPCRKVGLTAEKAAHLVMDNGWETFGVPAVITSDQGSQFVGQWWKTMCARLGIRQAYSQAYRAQANGRAEVAGKTLIGIMRKLHADGRVNWVEALPCVLRTYHDIPGEGGLSPFQIVFGRERYVAGIPYEIPRECEGAHAFFTRMEALDREVASILNKRHEQEAERVNAGRMAPDPFVVGDRVWVLRPKGSGMSKLDTWWVGPCEVTGRVGDLSYRVQVKPGVVQDVHRDQLKPWVEDALEGGGVPLFHHSTGYKALETEPDEWEVEEIRGHRVGRSGGLELLTKWVGTPEGEETWEPVQNFILKFCDVAARYLHQKGVKADLVESLPGVEERTVTM